MRFKLGCLIFCGCCLWAAALSEPLPKTASESLAGQQVTLPDSFKGHPALVVVGFSKSSQTGVKEWEGRAHRQLGESFDVYQVAVLEDAPRFVRGMIVHAMKRVHAVRAPGSFSGGGQG